MGKESVDLFFYRDADEIKRQQDAKQNKLRREKERASGYAQQAQQEEDEMGGGDADMYGDDMGQYEQEDAQQGMQQGDGQYAQENWDMPTTAIDDWGNEDNAAMQQPQQQQVDEYGQEQQQQQYDQYGQQGYQDPNDGGMGMQNW